MSDDNNNLNITISGTDDLTPTMQAAIDSVNSLSENVQGLTDQYSNNSGGAGELNAGLINLEAGVELVKTGIELLSQAYEVLSEQVAKAIEASSAYETASNKVDGALVSTGQYTEEARVQLQLFAEEQEKLTGTAASTTLGITAQAVQMGMSTDRAEEMVQAAQKLSVVTGQDLNSAFNQLAGSLAGQTRGLAKVLPQIKDFSAGQLKAGDAIDLVNQQLSAQFELYEGSYSAGVSRAQGSIESLYKAFGDVITQNPAVKAVIDQLASLLQGFSGYITANKAEISSWVTDGILKMVDAAAFLNVAFDDIYRGGVIAFNGINGALQTLALGVVSVVDGPFALLYKALSYLPGEQGQKFQAMSDQIGQHMVEMSNNIQQSATNIDTAMAGQTTASKAVENGLISLRASVEGATAADQKHKEAIDAKNVSMSTANAQTKQLMGGYGEYEVGTLAQRNALDGQEADRAADYKKFEDYYNQKINTAVTKEAEQAQKVEAFKASLNKGGAGSGQATQEAKADQAAQAVKQQRLKTELDEELITQEQYQQLSLQSQQTYEQDQLKIAQAAEMDKEKDLQGTYAGLQKQQELEKQQDDLASAQRVNRLKAENATDNQIAQAQAQAKLQQDARANSETAAYYAKQATMEKQAGNTFASFLDTMKEKQVQEGTVMGTLHAVQQSDYYKTEETMLTNLSSLRSSKSREAFSIGQKAAIAQATVNTFMSATEAYASLASIPYVGPILGAAAAAAAVAAGFVNIQQISSQSFQAHGGMDEVPQSGDNQSFTLSAGERVVQPTANKDLTDFLAQQKNGGTTNNSNASNYAITVNYTGTASSSDANGLAQTIVQQIRLMSERGNPVINSKGVYS